MIFILYIFILESITIVIVKFLMAATCCSLLQQPSLSPAAAQPPASSAPTPQVPSSPGGPEAVNAVVAALAARPAAWWSPVSAPIYCSTVAPSCPLCLFPCLLIDPAATEYCHCTRTVADWLQNPAVVVEFRYLYCRRSLGLQYTCIRQVKG